MHIGKVSNSMELEEIIQLQKLNHVSNIPADKLPTHGFVTVQHSLDDLRKMQTDAPQIIVKNDNHVIAYALAMPKKFKNLIPDLIPMFDILDKVEYDGNFLSDHNYYVMGQICIDLQYRGLGLFDQLYKEHKNVFASQYDLCITEVSTRNSRSMAAHIRTGFKQIHTYRDDREEWNIMVWDWRGNSGN